MPRSKPAFAIESGSQLQVREGDREAVPSGFRALDALLPAGGVRRGSLVEWLVVAEAAGPGQHGTSGIQVSGSGAVTLAGAVACRLAAARPGHRSDAGGVTAPPRTIVVVDRSGWFHPPAMLPWLVETADVDERQLVVARPSHDDDEIWAIDQALRCPGVAAVLAWPRVVGGMGRRGGRGDERSWQRSPHQWSIAMRRWQLAARSSGAVGLFVRQDWSHREATWAEARIAVAPLTGGSLCERRLRVTWGGGTWSAAGDGQPIDLVLDMTRGREPTARGRTAPVPGKRGVSCRAS